MDPDLGDREELAHRAQVLQVGGPAVGRAGLAVPVEGVDPLGSEGEEIGGGGGVPPSGGPTIGDRLLPAGLTEHLAPVGRSGPAPDDVTTRTDRG